MLDRDGTIIPDRAYTRDPDDVTLLPGAAAAIRRLAAAGFPSIVITNQSGIARGLISLAQYAAVRKRLEAFHRQTMPVTTFYKQKSWLREVDGTGPVDKVFERIQRSLV